MDKEINKEILIQRIEQLCTERKIKPTVAYTESGAGKNFKSNLSKANPSLGKITVLANYFGVSVEYLTGVSDERNASEHKNGIAFPTSDTLSKDESKLLLTYKILTGEGKKKAADYLDDLAGNPNYVLDDEIIYLPTAAFDGRFGAGEKVPYTVKDLRTLLSAEEIEGEDF